jgi:hypothetical protein
VLIILIGVMSIEYVTFVGPSRHYGHVFFEIVRLNDFQKLTASFEPGQFDDPDSIRTRIRMPGEWSPWTNMKPILVEEFLSFLRPIMLERNRTKISYIFAKER